MPSFDSFVTYSQPMSRIHGARFVAHDYVEGPSDMNPGDVNWESHEDAHSGVIFELGNLPPGSEVRCNIGRSAGTSPCAAIPEGSPNYSGARAFVDVWVRPKLGGALRAEKYLGYVVCQHIENVNEGEVFLVVSAAGFAITAFADVWAPEPVNGRWPVRTRDGGKLCWTGPHVHTFAARDAALEAADGTYTTGIQQTYSGGQTGRTLGVASEIYRWEVTWTW